MSISSTISSVGGMPRASAARKPGMYPQVLAWLFTLFNSARAVAYLPTIWAIQSSGDSSQHSLWTWLTWMGANLTMAAWLYEQNANRPNRAVIVNVLNACFCLVTSVLIVMHRA